MTWLRSTSVLAVAAALVGSLSATTATAQNWTDKITLGGDFRFRTESIKEQTGKATVDEPGAYYRNSLRVRLMTNAKINEMADVKVRLSTGSATQSGVTSSMQVQETPEKKGIFLDYAYAEIRPADDLAVWVGKSVNPYYFAGKSEMLYSADVTFEGASLKYSTDLGMIKPFFNAGAHWLQQRNTSIASTSTIEDTSAPSSGILALQLGSMMTMDKMFLNVAAAFFNHTNMRNQDFGTGGTAVSPFNSSATAGNFKGNTTRGTAAGQTYDNNFYLFNAGTELGMNDLFLGKALTLYFDYVNNSGAPGQINSGYTAGMSFGQLKKQGDFMVGYFFRELKADAAIGVLTDSSFGGGSTNVAGHMATVGWQFMDNTNIQAVYYGTRKDAFAIDDETGLKPKHYERAMINANMTF